MRPDLRIHSGTGLVRDSTGFDGVRRGSIMRTIWTPPRDITAIVETALVWARKEPDVVVVPTPRSSGDLP